ncbi:MAG: hypothetical protein GY782_06530 [Gammaproteobacteria bacterium]|nr:hypothetical protein [Gammaproteobacteria bacterium]
MKEYIIRRNDTIVRFDKEDEERIKKYKVRVVDSCFSQDVRVIVDGRSINMGRYLLDVDSTVQVVHANGDCFDFRKMNLKKRKRIKTRERGKFTGVHWVEKRKKWVANINHCKNDYYLGAYAKEKDAAMIVDAAYIFLGYDWDRNVKDDKVYLIDKLKEKLS